MSNPTPRPALRKADDADVHPAAPISARSPRSARTPRSATEGPRPTGAARTSPGPARAAVATETESDAAATGSGSATVSMMPEAGEKQAQRRAKASAVAAAEAAAATPEAPPTKAPRTRKFSGATSDHLRVTEPARAVVAPAAELLKGKSAELEVRVPKALKKAARAEAKKRGLDLDTVVIDLLHAWLTEQR
jgi:hypothetical protein